MKTPLRTQVRNVAILCGMMIAFTSVSWADCVVWSKIVAGVRTDWAKNYPGEKVLKVEKSGASSQYEKIIGPNRKARYCMQPLKVTVDQQGTRTIFNITFHYRYTGAGLVFDHSAVGESMSDAGKGKEPPVEKELRQLIIDAYLKKNTRVKEVTGLTYMKPEFKKADVRWWYNLTAEITAVNNEGQKCIDRRVSVSIARGGNMNEGKDLNAPWSVDIYPSGCTPQ